jgi:pimeloyl-ACP methyl ester carboxylesterase
MPRAYAEAAFDEYTPATKRQVLAWYRAMNPSVFDGWDQRFLTATASVPKQVVWGDLDPFIGRNFAERFGGTVTHVTTCGHWTMLEDPDLAAARILLGSSA